MMNGRLTRVEALVRLIPEAADDARDEVVRDRAAQREPQGALAGQVGGHVRLEVVAGRRRVQAHVLGPPPDVDDAPPSDQAVNELVLLSQTLETRIAAVPMADLLKGSWG